MVFKRCEMKYMLTPHQHCRILQAIAPYMVMDNFGHSEIRNLYYDTDNFRLIRTSMEHPIYKEKLRLRSYGRAEPHSPVFAELKKKYDGIVYKRRICMDYAAATECLSGRTPMPEGQIGSEIAYALSYYGRLAPKVFLSYEREAFYETGGGDFRVTFDENIRFRQNELTLTGDCSGRSIIGNNMVLMELKTSGSIPGWMTGAMSELGIYKTSFSKYGSAYTIMLHDII